MNPIEQVEAEKLAKDVVRSTEALSALAEPRRTSKRAWLTPIALGFVGFTHSGAINWISNGEIFKYHNLTYMFVCIFAWAGFGLATIAYHEAQQNKKRLEAALTLLNLK